MRIKMFYGSGREIEKDVNNFIEEKGVGIEIIDIEWKFLLDHLIMVKYREVESGE